MKTIVRIVIVALLGIFLYLRYENSLPKDEGKLEKSITPDSINNKDATVGQNNLAYSQGLIPVLSCEKSTHYKGWNKKIDSTKATALFNNKVTKKNETIKVQYAAHSYSTYDQIVYGVVSFIVFAILLFTCDRKNWSLSIVLILGLGAIVWLGGLYYFTKIDNETLKLVLWTILTSSAISTIVMIWSGDGDSVETVGVIVFILSYLIILAILGFYFDLAEIKIFFYVSLPGFVVSMVLFFIGIYIIKQEKQPSI